MTPAGFTISVRRQLRTVRRQVPTSVFQSLIGALVLSRLDYCNSVLFGLDANLIQRLQSVQNAAARLIFRIRRSEHITQRSSAFTGCASQNVSTSNCQLWRIDPSTAPLRPTYSHVSPAFPTWHPDDGCGLLPHIVWCSVRSTLYSRQAGVSGFWCHRLERPASPRHICSVTRGFQTTTQDLFSSSYQDTIIWLVCYYHHSSLPSWHPWSLQ